MKRHNLTSHDLNDVIEAVLAGKKPLTRPTIINGMFNQVEGMIDLNGICSRFCPFDPLTSHEKGWKITFE